MKITGYQLMDRIEVLREQAQTINSQFTGSLLRFAEETEKKPDPQKLMKDYIECERKVAILQAAQASYNVNVTVEVLGESMSLQEAVKIIGSANRVKDNWLAAVKAGTQKASYGEFYDLVRAKDNEYAQRAVTVEECLRLSKEASDFATALKQAIRAGNATEVNVNIDPSMFR